MPIYQLILGKLINKINIIHNDEHNFIWNEEL